MTWVLVFWILMDRGGGPATAEFSSREKCEAAAHVIFATPRYAGEFWSKIPPPTGNYACVEK